MRNYVVIMKFDWIPTDSYIPLGHSTYSVTAGLNMRLHFGIHSCIVWSTPNTATCECTNCRCIYTSTTRKWKIHMVVLYVYIYNAILSFDTLNKLFLLSVIRKISLLNEYGRTSFHESSGASNMLCMEHSRSEALVIVQEWVWCLLLQFRLQPRCWDLIKQ